MKAYAPCEMECLTPYGLIEEQSEGAKLGRREGLTHPVRVGEIPKLE